MSILSQHIEYLLISHDCVILPGVGAFIVSYRSARIDETGRRILPPSREVSFNPAVTADDGLLAHSIARRSRLPFEEARERLEELIAELRHTLQESGLVELGMVGHFTLGPEGALVFTPALDAPAQWNLLGLFALAIPRRPEEGRKLDIKEARTPGPSRAEEIGKISDSYYHFRVSKRALRVAASVLVALGLCLSVVLFPLDTATETGEQMASIIPVWSEQKDATDSTGGFAGVITDGTVTEAASSDVTVTEEVEGSLSAGADGNEAASFAASDDDAGVKADESAAAGSHLIVGAFKTDEGARAFIAQKAKEGISGLEIVITSSGNRLISAYSGTHESVRAEMNRPATRSRYPESWILD